MLDWLRNLLGPASPDVRAQAQAAHAIRRAAEAKIRARYDAASVTDLNRKGFAETDLLSAKSANSFMVRQQLRRRSRYEVANSCWLRGLVNRWSNYLIGTGPRLQVLTKDRHVNQQVEAAWSEWVDACGLVEKLRVMKKAKVQDGEAFAVFRSNPRQLGSVQLYVQEIEADQVMTPNPGFLDRYWVDGMELDDLGNPSVYHILRNHPGDLFWANFSPLKYDRVPARLVMHWFKKDRPGQVRAVPELTPALELISMLRRFALATLGTAEFAASLSTVLETDAPADGEPLDGNPFEQFEFERNMHMRLPDGHHIKGFQSNSPPPSYGEFEKAILRQIASALDIPYGLAVADFSGSNYSSGRLDVQSFAVALKVERKQCADRVLDPIFGEWLHEATKVPHLLPADLPAVGLPHVWRWPATPHVDPVKEMTAKVLAITNNLTTLASACADYDGSDYEDVFAQRAIEVALANRLGIVQVPPGAVPPTGIPESDIDRAMSDESESPDSVDDQDQTLPA